MAFRLLYFFKQPEVITIRVRKKTIMSTNAALHLPQAVQPVLTKNIPAVSLPVEFISAIGSAESITAVLNTVARWLPQIITAERASITLAADENYLRLFAIQGNEAIAVGKLLPMDKTMVGRVHRNRTLEIADDLADYQNADNMDCQMLYGAGLQTCMDAPLVCGDECYGTVNVGHTQRYFYTEQHAVVLRCLASWIASHIRIHRQIQRMSTLAMTDPLTQVLNRRAFLETAQARFSQWQSNQSSFVLAMFDLDHFKQINDRYGHAGGDKILTAFSEQLTSLVRQGDCVARLGGEEFAIILQGMKGDIQEKIVQMTQD